MNFAECFQFFMALFAVVNPLGKIPLWIEATEDKGKEVRVRLILYVVLTAVAILATMSILGKQILNVFGISIASFRIGGGIIILLMGLSMIKGEVTSIDKEKGKEKGNVKSQAKKRFKSIVFPIAFPLIAGPGSITTVLLYSNRASGLLDYIALVTVVMLTLTIVGFLFFCSYKIEDVIGELTLGILTRIFGLILAAIAVQLIVEGLGVVFPAWLDSSSPLIEDIEQIKEVK